jgi:hypothetical protein
LPELPRLPKSPELKGKTIYRRGREGRKGILVADPELIRFFGSTNVFQAIASLASGC